MTVIEPVTLRTNIPSILTLELRVIRECLMYGSLEVIPGGRPMFVIPGL